MFCLWAKKPCKVLQNKIYKLHVFLGQFSFNFGTIHSYFKMDLDEVCEHDGCMPKSVGMLLDLSGTFAGLIGQEGGGGSSGSVG